MESRHGDQEYQGRVIHKLTFFIPFSHLSLHHQTGQKRILFDVAKDGQSPCPKWVPPESQQEPNESRRQNRPHLPLHTIFLYIINPFVLIRLWYDLTQAITTKDMNKATDAKMAVEEAQREQRRKMEDLGTRHIQTFFEQRSGRWMPKIEYVSPVRNLTLADVFSSKSSLRPQARYTSRCRLAFWATI